MIVLWIVAAVGITVLVKSVGADTSNNITLPGTGSQLATDLLKKGFPPQQNGQNPIIFHAAKGKVTDSANKTAITDSYKAITKIHFVDSAVSPFAQGAGAQISKDKKTAFISVLLKIASSDLSEDEAQKVIDAAEPGKKAGMQVEGGSSIGTVLSPNDTSTSDVIGILAAMIILTFTFGTVVAMGMPIANAVLGLTTALGVIGLLGHVLAVPDISHTVATMIGLAVGIDYALFLVTRHRTQLREGIEMRESIALAVGTAGTAVVFAGCTVVVALVSLAVAGIPLVSALGYTAAIAVATAVLAAITLLPAFMSLAGRFINSIALPKRLRPSDDPDKVGMWGHWSNFVTRRPWIAIALAALILIPLILPVLRLRLGQENIGQTPKSTMERRAYDLMARGFGPGFNGPMLVAIALVPKAQADPAVAAQEKQATDLQNELKAEQKQGNQMADELKSGQASAERQQAVLEKKQASLNQQAAALKAQQSSLQAQQASLQAQANRLGAEANQLTNEKNRLEAEARALAGRAKGEAETLIRVGAQIQGLERLISGTSDPARLELLNARLARLETQQAATKKQLANDEVAAKSLKRQAERLPPRAARLEAQKASLQSQAAALQAAGGHAPAAGERAATAGGRPATAGQRAAEAGGCTAGAEGGARRASGQGGGPAEAAEAAPEAAHPRADQGRRQRPRHRPAAGEAAGRADQDQGRQAGGPAQDLKVGERCGDQRDSRHGAVVGGHRPPRQASAQHGDPRQQRARASARSSGAPPQATWTWRPRSASASRS